MVALNYSHLVYDKCRGDRSKARSTCPNFMGWKFKLQDVNMKNVFIFFICTMTLSSYCYSQEEEPMIEIDVEIDEESFEDELLELTSLEGLLRKSEIENCYKKKHYKNECFEYNGFDTIYICFTSGTTTLIYEVSI